MTDIKSMFAKMSNDKGGGDEPAPAEKAGPKKGTIEKTYQKKSQLEHILLRPDTYIGSVEKQEEIMWIYDETCNKMIQKQIEFVPGLYKIFDEILVNAADNKQRDPTMDCIKVEIKPETNTVSVWNNGQGIPVVMHKDEKMYVPTMIFGHLLTSSNYNDEEEKVTGGRNGYGAKLCNIFSTKFTVETASKQYKRQFKQTWGDNMTKTSEPKIKDFFGDDFTKITFSPDLAKFKMTNLNDDIVALMSRRAYDIAASTRGVKVFLNGKRLPIKNFRDYVELFIKDREDDSENKLKVLYENPHERWEVAFTLSNQGFQQMSFVNSIATTKGGRHVDYIVDMIVKQLVEILKKKNKGGTAIKPFQVKSHIWIFINCLIVNPTFDSQTKENMTLQPKNFGSKCVLPEKFIQQVTKAGIIEAVLTWAKFKQQTELEKKGGKKQSKLRGIPKLEDANEAGKKDALKCTLILTEGDSAKTLVVSGFSVIGRDYYGVFPLKGKMLNVREATHKQRMENQEIESIIKILGLQYKKKYNTDEDMKTLRYGKLMIMTDQDQDGSHIKGLLINFIHFNWPELLKRDFLEEFITPIVKATKKNQELSFYSLPEFEEWKEITPNHHTFNIKYYKGLGTSTSKEAKEYFSNMDRHRIKFRHSGQQDDDNIVLAFSKKHVEHRKEWLTNFMVESKRRKEIGLPEKYLYTKNTKTISYSDFVNMELVLFSNMDNVRSIPCLVDGLKPGQRKVMYTCFRRNDKREVKVAQLSGFVAAMSAYHHGEMSLCMTIVNLAQNYVGSNNINLLEPRGQFGTRMNGGKDSASARYIFTKMSPITRLIFHPSDDALLKHEFDDNQKIEPVWYLPIIPMLLVNGADGIGTGWMTKIPNYNPREITDNIRRMLDGEEPLEMKPWYKNFKGTIEFCGEGRYACSGEIAIIGRDKLEITELPIGTWTQNYKEHVLEPMLGGAETKNSADKNAEKGEKGEKIDKAKHTPKISDYKEYNTDTTVRFVVSLAPEELQKLRDEGLHKAFKLQSIINTTSMCVFDELGCIRKFEGVIPILQEYYTLRLAYYQKRKDFMEGMLKAEADKLTDQARFILEKCNGTLVVENKKRKTIVDELLRRGYNPDPVLEWKERIKIEDDGNEEGGTADADHDAGAEDAQPATSKAPVMSEKEISDVKKFDYLLGMSMWMLTEEKKNELLRQKEVKLEELAALKKKTKGDLWRHDLDVFVEKLDQLEEKERKEETNYKGSKIAKAEKKPGKKKALLDIMPSPVAQRVAPTIGDDLKKRIQNLIKVKDKKALKKSNSSQEIEVDEFDAMVQSNKTIKNKLGTPEDAEKKAKGKKGKDGLKQTKLNFKPENANGKANGAPKKRRVKKNLSEDEDITSHSSGSDSDFSASPVRPRRQAAKKTFKDFSDEEGFTSDDEPEMIDNTAIKEPSIVKESMAISSGSEDESPPPQRLNETSEDMFDSLVGRKKEETKKVEEPSGKRKKDTDTQSDSDIFLPKETQTKKPRQTKKKKKNTSDEDMPKPTKKKSKKISDDDYSEDDLSKKNSKNKQKDASLSDDSPVAKTGRAARNVKQSKYVFSDSEESD